MTLIVLYFDLVNSLEYVPDVKDWHDSAVCYGLQTQRIKHIKYNSHQLRELEETFAVNRYPSLSERNQLARKVGVTESRIQVHMSLSCQKTTRFRFRVLFFFFGLSCKKSIQFSHSKQFLFHLEPRRRASSYGIFFSNLTSGTCIFVSHVCSSRGTSLGINMVEFLYKKKSS